MSQSSRSGPQGQPNTLRRNPFTRRWTIFTESELPQGEFLERTRRAAATAQLRSVHPCPFCPGHEALTPPEILVWRAGGIRYRRDGGTSGSDWEVRVFPNRHPIFRLEGDLGRRAERNHDAINAVGANEIIVEMREHATTWQDVPPEVVRRALLVYRERMRDLRRNPALGHQALYKHVGLRRASQIVHPYSQLIASPVVPERVREELNAFRLHFRQKERCLACDLVHEIDRASRDCQVVDHRHFSAFVPFFAPHPFEIWVLPRRHAAHFPDATDEEIESAAQVLWTCLRRLDRVVGTLAMTLMLHTAPNPDYAAQHGYWRTLGEDYHWRLVVVPRLPVVTDLYRGFVLGTGFDVNPLLPEHAGTLLRQAGT